MASCSIALSMGFTVEFKFIWLFLSVSTPMRLLVGKVRATVGVAGTLAVRGWFIRLGTLSLAALEVFVHMEVEDCRGDVCGGASGGAGRAEDLLSGSA